jgi:hypothetical protein
VVKNVVKKRKREIWGGFSAGHESYSVRAGACGLRSRSPGH